MKLHLIISSLLILNFLACGTKDLKLIQNSASNYEIVLPDIADSIEMKSAHELQKYLLEKTSVLLPIIHENSASYDKRIYIGNTEGGKSLKAENDEIVIKVQDNNVFILGGDSKSTLYAVYTFLENYLDCRFYSPEVEFIPRADDISIPEETNYRYMPPVTTRTVHSRLFYMNHDFADKRKTTYQAFPKYVPSARVHTFHRFVPADKYYKTHPEFYALRNGKRIPTQLCLTNSDVLDIVITVVDSLLDAHPESDVISVSQDDNQQYCECHDCMLINDREGTPSGSVIDFVNKVALEFPDKMISTLAYQYTRTAPKHIKPGKNVLITLCSIECDRSAPINEKCIDFTDDLVAWGKLTDNIRIWDYTTQFTNFLAPFPNIYTLQPNIQLFRDNNAKWIFEQHSHHPSELFELRSYLTAKLLWDPDINQDSIISDFLTGYYEEAAPFIQNYISTIHEALQEDPGFFLFLYGDPSQGFQSFLSPELLKRYDLWFDKAEKAVQGKPEVIKRVNRARLSTDYAILEAARMNDPATFFLVSTSPDGDKVVPGDLSQRIDRFAQTCKEADITLMNEMGYTVNEYLEFYEYTISRAMEENIAVGRKVRLLQPPKKYANEDPQILTDGTFGGTSFFANWLGFEGNDLEAVINLESGTGISQVSIDFLQVVNHVVFFPTRVDYYYSGDGNNFSYLGKVENKKPLTKQSKVNDVQSFKLEFSPIRARYIKVVAKSMGMAPVWHHGAGTPCWIFADEISVR